MSYILEALKKAQRAHSALSSDVPDVPWSFETRHYSRVSIWIYLLIVLNGLLLTTMFIMLRPAPIIAENVPPAQTTTLAVNQTLVVPTDELSATAVEDTSLRRAKSINNSLLQQHTPPPRSPEPIVKKESELPWLQQLPSDMQAALPKLTLQAHVYDRKAAQRFVLLQGKRLSEGAQIAPQLWLEQIRPEDAIMRFHQQKFRISRLSSDR